MPAIRLHHVNLRAKDPVPTVEFYRKLGFSLIGCAHAGDIYTLYLALPSDKTYIEITVNPAGEADWLTDMGVGHLALTVDDIDLTVDELKSVGVVPTIEPFHPGGRPDVKVAFLTDPTGYKVELMNGGEFVPPQEALPSSLAFG